MVSVVVSMLALAWAHGARIVANLGAVQWEDRIFFTYTRQHVHSLVDCFARRGPYPGLYRPLTTNLFYFLGLHVLGERLLAYHLILIVVVVANAALLHRIAHRLIPSRWALLAPILWVSRLANVEVVTHTCEFQGLLSAFWLLVAIDAFARDRPSLSTVATALALLSKETAIALPAILLAYHLTIERKRARDFAGVVAVCLAWAIGALVVASNDAPGFAADGGLRNLLHNLAAYLLSFSNLLVRPLDGAPMAPAVASLAGRAAVQAAVALLIAAGLWALARPHRFGVIVFGWTWWLLATLPVAPFQQRLFMRYAYFGHAGLALAAAAAAALAADFVLARYRQRKAGETS